MIDVLIIVSALVFVVRIDSNQACDFGIARGSCLAVGSTCLEGYQCVDGQCCQAKERVCPGDQLSHGLCDSSGLCPDPGHVCYTTDDDVKVCCNNTDHVTGYLKLKWWHWFSSLDINNDDTISRDDLKECQMIFTELHGLKNVKAKSAKEDIEKWWNKCIFRIGKDLSEKDFLERLITDYEKNNTMFRQSIEECYTEGFKILDVDKDGTLDCDEFFIAYKAFGHDDDTILTNLDKSYKATDDKVPMKQIVDSWVHFLCDDYEEKEDEIEKAFEQGL